MNLGDGVDMNTFSQILEMDEPGDTEFSHSIVFGFFEQAEETFVSMDTALWVHPSDEGVSPYSASATGIH